MNIVVQGGTKSPVPGSQAIIDALRGSGRASISPFDHSDGQGNILGFYRVSANTTTYTGASGGILATARWTDNHSFMVPLRLSVCAIITTAVVAANRAATDLDLIIARSYSAAQAGGTAIAPFAATNSQKCRSNMGTSLISDLRVGTTANLTITAANYVLDAQGAGNVLLAGAPVLDANATASTTMCSPFDVYKYDTFGQYPIVLGQNEGWVLKHTSYPAGAVMWFGITYEWAELALF